MQSYILMIDYGKGPEGPKGFEAVVNPEQTRRQIVSEVADIFDDPCGRQVVFVKFVNLDYGNLDDCIDDVTAEIFAEAEALMLEAA